MFDVFVEVDVLVVVEVVVDVLVVVVEINVIFDISILFGFGSSKIRSNYKNIINIEYYILIDEKFKFLIIIYPLSVVIF